jgi:hypothetical protein
MRSKRKKKKNADDIDATNNGGPSDYKPLT